MDLKLSVFRKVEHCFLLAEQHFECRLSRPRVSFDVRGQDAGRAYFPVSKTTKKNQFPELRFNSALLELNPEDFIGTVVPHECAHLIAYELFGTAIKAHGREWQSLMEGLFQQKAHVKHNFDVSLVANKPFIYNCSCLHEIALSKRQHNTVKRGGQYLCKRCRSQLHFSHQIELPVKQPKKEGIEGLYIHYDGHKPLDTRKLKRLDFIINKKAIKGIYSSKDLTGDEYFQQWLKANRLVRKYFGKMDKEELFMYGASGMNNTKLISHAVLFLDASEEINLHPWLAIKQKGVTIRTLKYK